LDVADEASMRAAVEAVEAEAGAVGARVNNAGYSQSGALESLPIDDLRASAASRMTSPRRSRRRSPPSARRSACA